MNAINYTYVTFCLISLDIRFTKFIHVVACVRTSFLFMAE